MQIQPITELAYNQAKMTIDAMRQELLWYRDEFPKMQARITELERAITVLEDKTKPQIIKTDNKDANNSTNIRDNQI